MTNAALPQAAGQRAESDLTIVGAISAVLRDAGKPLTPTEVYEAIVAKGLYRFKAADPLAIVVTQIRRHCKDLQFMSSAVTRYFGLSQDGKYILLAKPVRVRAHKPEGSDSRSNGDDRVSHSALMRLYEQYNQKLRTQILTQLKRMTPIEFERFGTRMLKAYGFSKLEVTPPSRDGGIDGFGHLRVGVAELRVAFQCKRWDRRSVGIFEVQRFRGAIQGRAQHGVFFTTARFSSDAEKESFAPGAVPVVLLDGPAIVDIMVEKGVGVTIESLPVPRFEPDLAVQPEDV